MRMLKRFRKIKYRCKTDIGAFKLLAPLSTGFCGKNLHHGRLTRRPLGLVPLVGKYRILGELEPLQEQAVELGLERTNCDVLTISAEVGIVPGRSKISPTRTRLIAELTRVVHSPE